MGYSEINGVWQHPERKVIFAGDYIDRGPEIVETVRIVRGMTEAGTALAIMGNHEYNALAFHFHRPDGGHIRKHSIKNIIQHFETLKQFQHYEVEWAETLAWMANLPLFLDLEGFRIVHACWDTDSIEFIKGINGPLERDLLLEAHKKGSATWRAFETILKGPEIQLPDGFGFEDKDGNYRNECRIKWWLDPQKHDLGDYLFLAPEAVVNLPVPAYTNFNGYPVTDPPVFFGHYWLKPGEGPSLQAPNVCCLDYSVAKGGLLVGYSFDKETPELSNLNFKSV